MQTADALNEAFGLPGALTFDEAHPGLVRASIATPVCTAELFLQGAHLTQWNPEGEAPVLFLSSRSTYAPGKAIRGGIPLIFPWFGPAATSPVPTPDGAAQHGFARTAAWTLRFAALAGEDLHLSLTLDQTEGMHAAGFNGFEVAYELILGSTLTARLSVANTGETPFPYEDALHAYLNVGDSREVSVEGLQGTEFLDKTDAMRKKTEGETVLTFAGEVDRPHLNTTSSLVLHDPVLQRRLLLEKEGSRSTVTWNPGEALASTLPDVGPGEWTQFVCLEPGNVNENHITLQPREAHTTQLCLQVERL